MGVVTVHALQKRSLTEAQRTRSEEGGGRNGRGRFRHNGWKEMPNPKHGNRNKHQTRNPSDGKQIGPIISTEPPGIRRGSIALPVRLPSSVSGRLIQSICAQTPAPETTPRSPRALPPRTAKGCTAPSVRQGSSPHAAGP